MKRLANTFRTLAGLTIGLAMVAPAISWGQATSSVIVPVSAQALKKQIDGSQQLDLLFELKKINPALSNVEIQMVRAEAKSNIGGAQLFLKINNEFVATSVVETDPDQFGVEEARSYGRFELKNIERARINSAIIQIQNASNVKLKSLEVILGAVQEPVVFGRYAQDQSAVVGGADMSDDRDMRPTAEALAAVYGTYYGTDADADAPAEQTQNQYQPYSPYQDPYANQNQSVDNSSAANSLRRSMADGLVAAERGDQRTAEAYLTSANDYYRDQKYRVGYGQRIMIEDEVLSYIAKLQEICKRKAMAVQEERARLNQGRPQINYNAPVRCLKTKKKKIMGKKEFCIGDFVPGVWTQHAAPKIIDIDGAGRTIKLLFDYSNQPLVMSVDQLPDAR